MPHYAPCHGDINDCIHHTAGSDYVPVNEALLFSPEDDPVQCFTVSIIDDNITESDQVFTLLISSSDRISQVTTTMVKILDNDGTKIGKYEKNDTIMCVEKLFQILCCLPLL